MHQSDKIKIGIICLFKPSMYLHFPQWMESAGSPFLSLLKSVFPLWPPSSFYSPPFLPTPPPIPFLPFLTQLHSFPSNFDTLVQQMYTTPISGCCQYIQFIFFSSPAIKWLYMYQQYAQEEPQWGNCGEAGTLPSMRKQLLMLAGIQDLQFIVFRTECQQPHLLIDPHHVKPDFLVWYEYTMSLVLCSGKTIKISKKCSSKCGFTSQIASETISLKDL